MNGPMTHFLIAVGIFILLLVGAAGYGFYHRRSRRDSENAWENLLARLALVNRERLQQIAFDVIDESGKLRTDDHAKELKPEQIWRLIGGLEGLEILEQNSLVLIDMAYYLQKWYPEAAKAAEELRLKAREIEWHVGRLRTAAQAGTIESWFANYAQNTVAAYYLMTCRLLALYETGGLSRLADVQKAL
jgi:hypothetical protein